MSKKDSVTYTCLSCDKKFEHAGMMAHLKDVHAVDIKQKISGQMVAHMDGLDWFSTTDKFTAENGTEFYRTVRCTRAKDDMMRFA